MRPINVSSILMRVSGQCLSYENIKLTHVCLSTFSSNSTFSSCKSSTRSSPESIDKFFFTFYHYLLFFIFLILETSEFFSFFYTVCIISRIDIDTIFPENLYGSCTSTIEELTVMRYNQVSSLPCMFQIVLEPFYTREIDEVSRLIE